MGRIAFVLFGASKRYPLVAVKNEESGGNRRKMVWQEYPLDSVGGTTRLKVLARIWLAIQRALFSLLLQSTPTVHGTRVSRDKAGDVRAFYNVCQHRAHELVTGDGNEGWQLSCGLARLYALSR